MSERCNTHCSVVVCNSLFVFSTLLFGARVAAMFIRTQIISLTCIHRATHTLHDYLCCITVFPIRKIALGMVITICKFVIHRIITNLVAQLLYVTLGSLLFSVIRSGSIWHTETTTLFHQINPIIH